MGRAEIAPHPKMMKRMQVSMEEREHSVLLQRVKLNRY